MAAMAAQVGDGHVLPTLTDWRRRYRLVDGTDPKLGPVKYLELI